MLAAGVVALAGCGSGSDNPLRLAAEGPTTTLAGAAPTTTADATAPSTPGGSGAAGSTTVAGSSTTAAVTTTTEARPGVDALAAIALTTQPIADIEQLTAMAVRPGDTSIYVTTQTGQVYRIPKGGGARQGARSHRHRVRVRDRLRRGLLGLAFSPVDGRMFLYYTDLQAQAHLVSYAVGDNGIPDPDSVWKVLDIAEPGAGHKGGGINITDDGTLYLAVGDGGGSRGRDAQDMTKTLGAILRIVPSTTGPGYTVPDDNPFVGDSTKAPEIFAKGLRNPWGFWRDPVTDELWISDVGEDTVEELNRIPDTQTGANFGWYFVEGDNVRYQGAPADIVAPLFTYRHDDIGPAIIGGRVYRGSAIPGLDGAYVFADMAGRVMAMGAADQVGTLTVSLPSEVITGFGIGPDDELYVLTLHGGLFKIVPA